MYVPDYFLFLLHFLPIIVAKNDSPIYIFEYVTPM